MARPVSAEKAQKMLNGRISTLLLEMAAFSAARSGLEGLTYEMAKELGPYGITSNCILLGHFEQDVPEEDTLDEATRARMLSQTALGRLGGPSDVPAAVEFLASEEAGFVNGARIDVNGGWVIG